MTSYSKCVCVSGKCVCCAAWAEINSLESGIISMDIEDIETTLKLI